MTEHGPSPGVAGLSRQIGFSSAVGVIVSSMVGQAIFTTPGYVGSSLGHPLWMLGLWIAGGVVSLAGALCYAELGTRLPRPGGEYTFIHAAFGPLPAFLCGWGCFLAGFSGAIALSALAFSHYAAMGLGLSPDASSSWLEPSNIVAASLVAALTVFHAYRVRSGILVADLLTCLKAIIVGLLAAAALFSGKLALGGLEITGRVPGGLDLATTAATNLVYITLAYSGWNAVTYIAGEVKDPRRTIPRATVTATLAVTALYVGLNLIYLLGVPVTRMEPQPNIAGLAAEAYFGVTGGRVTAIAIALTQLATISAFVLTGSRVYYAMAHDGLAPRGIAAVTPGSSTPRAAVILQGSVAFAMALSSHFRDLAEYAGAVLGLFSALAMAALLALRRRQAPGDSCYRAPLGPTLPILYMAFTLYMLVFFVRGKLASAEEQRKLLLGVATIAAGVPVYFWIRWRARRAPGAH